MNRSLRLRAEPLEPRDVPAGQPFGPGNVLVDQAVNGGTGYVREYTPAGAFVRQIDIPPTEWANARDLAVAPDGRLVVVNGTFTPRLSVYDPVADSWTDFTDPDWGLFNVGTLGAVAVHGNFAFVTDDQNGSGAMSHGLFRFDLTTGAATHFADAGHYTELVVGFDGLLYALFDHTFGAHAVDVYDPDALTLVRTVTLDNVPTDDLYGMTLNPAGDIYVARGPYLYRVAPDGAVLGTADMTVIAPADPLTNSDGWDLETSLDGTRLLYVGGTSGYAAVMDLDFSDPVVFEALPGQSIAQAFGAFVNVPPVVPTIEIEDIEIVEGSASAVATFTIRLSEPTTVPVSVAYATRDGAAIAGDDYDAATGQVTFSPGETTKTVSVTVHGDLVAKPAETFELALSEPTGGVLGTAAATATVLDDDVPPVAQAGPDWAIVEGATVRFRATGSGPAPLTYLWDFGDGATATGPTPKHRYEGSGTFVAWLTVRDGNGSTATDTSVVTSANLPPRRAAIGGPANTVPGWARPLTFTGRDASPADQAALEYRIDWGDGQTETRTGGPTLTVGHAYATPGDYTVRLVVADGDGATTGEVRKVVRARTALSEAGTLYVPGTPGADAIEVRAVDRAGTKVAVAVNGTVVATGRPAAVTVWGRDGNDTITIVGSLKPRLVLLGGAGDDVLDASPAAGPVVLVGGDGADTVTGGAGRDVMIGGAGADVLDGGAGDDVAIGRGWQFETDPAALRRVSQEWARVGPAYETRRDRVLGVTPGGKNGPYLLSAATATADGSANVLTGGLDRDWFLAATADLVQDSAGNETVTAL